MKILEILLLSQLLSPDSTNKRKMGIHINMNKVCYNIVIIINYSNIDMVHMLINKYQILENIIE